MARTVGSAALPAALPALIDKYRDVRPKPVRFRPATWKGVLFHARTDLDVTTLLYSRQYTRPLATSKAKDRTVTLADVRAACGAMDIADDREVLQAFVLTMAWASDGTVNATLRATATALRDPTRAHRILGAAAHRLRAAQSMQEGAIEDTHRAWSLRGVGQSLASHWWSCAGHVAGRTWQPLILDDKVYATLNRTLMIGGTTRLASSRRRADRYRAYVEAVHRWAVELRLEGRDADAERIVFVLARHAGGVVPTT